MTEKIYHYTVSASSKKSGEAQSISQKELTKTEYKEQQKLNEQSEVEAKKTDIDLKITALEKMVTPRKVREAIISGDKDFIEEVEDAIELLRQQRKSL